METTKIATLGHNRPHHRSRLLGIGVGLMLSFLLLTAIFTASLSGIFVSANNDAPTELIIRNITDTTAQIYWTTQNETQGLVQYGTNPTQLAMIAPEVIGGKEHMIDLSLLKPASTYYFTIRIGDTIFDNGGTPWTFATKPDGFAGNPNDASAPQDDGAVAMPDTTMPACPDTLNCDVIKERLGQGCTTADYMQCLQKRK